MTLECAVLIKNSTRRKKIQKKKQHRSHIYYKKQILLNLVKIIEHINPVRISEHQFNFKHKLIRF